MSAFFIPDDVAITVRHALQEDIGSGDITAQLLPPKTQAKAQVITRENAVLCGQTWFNEVFYQLDPKVKVHWLAKDGEPIKKNQVICTLKGAASSILTGERCALNFLQTLSGTATLSKHYAKLVKGTGVKVLDTRKTLPGLRTAQKYAVRCGGCYNHRMGLYDAFLIKENHIAACGTITKAISKARQIAPNKSIEVEVENFKELDEALQAKADIIMLDNFTLKQINAAVAYIKGRAKLEVSGGVSLTSLKALAKTGVDFISVGSLTKHCKAIDLSLRFIN